MTSNLPDKTIIADKDAVITVDHLEKSFGNNKVLQDFQMKLFKGENLAVLGKSGSGKSVLIKCLIGLMKPEKGTITVLGEEVGNMSNMQLDVMRKRVGFLFQSNALYDSMSVRENLEFPLRRHKIYKNEKETKKQIDEMLFNVGLPQTADMMPSELSGGMKKRIALARTLILKPEIIFYDEPTTGLDPVTSREISNLIFDLQQKFKTSSLIISHDMNCVKITSSRIIILLNGQCYITDTYENLSKNGDKNVAQFFQH